MVNQTRPELHLFEYVFRTTSDGILIANAERLLAQVNPAAVAMFGITAEKVIGKTPFEVFSHNPSVMNLFNREGEQTLDVRLPRRRLAVGVGTTLPSGDRLVILTDVTEKRDLESRREALVKAMTHDLRNPISAIGGFADLVSKFGDLNEQQAKFLQRVRQTASKLHDVIEMMVELAWIEAGMPLEHSPVKLPEVIHDAISNCQRFAQVKQIIIATSIQNPMPTVMGDAERLRVVVQNLLHNAILYSHPEQTIVIHAWETSEEAGSGLRMMNWI
ncbi:MAG: PAS domain-containing protein [Anaerolineae bacterium]|nr:PAS domain-containing protein [Anaerolineae bacterium]